MHVHCLHWLMSTDPLFQGASCQPCKSVTGEMVPREGSNWQWRPETAPTASAHLSRPFSELLAHYGDMWTS